MSSPELTWEAVGTSQQISAKGVLGSGTAAGEMDSVSSDEFISPLFGLKHPRSCCSQHEKCYYLVLCAMKINFPEV